MIELRDVTIRSGPFRITNLNLKIEQGEYAVLMGKTGFGKTTILEAICGLRRVESGTIWIHAMDVTRWPPGDRQLGYVPQDLALFPSMNVRQQLLFALQFRKIDRQESDHRVSEIASVLGIEHLMKRKVQGLSGGEAQRVALGRALTAKPSVLLLDEPLSALDEVTRREMHVWLRKVKQTTGVTTLHVTHNEEEAEALADRRFVLDRGQLFESHVGT